MMITPLDKYNWITTFLGKYLTMCGSNFTDGNFNIPWRGQIYLGFMVMGISATIYTVLTAEVGFAMQAVVFLCIAVQGLVKFMALNWNRRDLYTLHRYLRNVCAQNSRRCTVGKQSSGYATMTEWLDVFVFITKYFSGVIMVSTIMIMLFPFIYIAMYGETTDLLPINLPYNDKTTVVGYLKLTAFHVLLLLVGSIGLLAADLSIGLFFLYVAPIASLVRLRLEEINDELHVNDKAAHSVDFYSYMRNLIEIHKDVCRYLQVVARIYAVTIFVEVNADGLSMMFSVYVAMVIKWYPIYFLFLTLLSKLFATCLLGAIVDDMTERMDAAIYNCNWYLMPVPLQRVFLLMLMRAQNPTVLKSGTVVLNLNLFVAVMKNIYSVGMLLLESVDE